VCHPGFRERWRFGRCSDRDHENALTKAGDGGLDVFNAVHNKRAGSAAKDDLVGNAVNVRVIPIETWRLVGREDDVILKSLARIDDGFDDLVSVASRRGICSVIVKC
jgi:hypothetical protein